jgi:predicted metal-dependent peptidase
MTKEDYLGKASKELMLSQPFYGFFLIMLNKIWSNKLPTAGVSKNGINYQLAINPEFWCNLSDSHRIGILQHELLHITNFHLMQYFNFPDRRMANIAMDMEINQYINKGFLPGDDLSKEDYDKLVESIKEKIAADLESGTITQEQASEEFKKIPMRGILIEDYTELNLDARAGSRYYYEKLKEAKDKKDKSGTSGSDSFDKLCDQLDNGDPGIDDHGTWEEFENLPEAEKKIIQQQLDRILKEAADQTVKKRGTIPGGISDYLIELEKLEKAKFNWKAYVRRFAGASTKIFTKKIRRKENRRFSDNPGLKIKMRQHMLLAIDTSGSVSNDEVTEFMNEIKHIHKCGVDVTIIQCDTTIRSIEPYDGKMNIKVHGRGGTEFDPVIEYFNSNLKKYTSLVYFTDGECDTDVKPKAPILWVLSERSSMNNSLPGKVIRLEL